MVWFAAPPGVANLELDAGVHSRIFVAQGCTGDVNAVRRKHKRMRRTEEVLKADSALRTEVENAGAAGNSVGNKHVGRKFVGGVDQSAGRLKPGRDAAVRLEVPPENDGSDAEAGKCASPEVRGVRKIEAGYRILIVDSLLVRRRRECLPVRHHFAGILELASQKARSEGAGNYLAEPE